MSTTITINVNEDSNSGIFTSPQFQLNPYFINNNLLNNNSFCLFTGGLNSIILLPDINTYSGQFYFIKNISQSSLTITGQYNQFIYDSSPEDIFLLNSGESHIIANANKFWIIM